MRTAWLMVMAGCWHESAPAIMPTRPIESTPIATARPRPPASPYADVAGTWKGVGYQYDTKGHWDLEMTLFRRANIGDVIGTIAYENGNCTAELTRQPERGDTLLMTEKLVTGHGKCVDGGTIRIPRRPVAGELDWRWDFASGTEGANATIKRE
jgi:hypothetical protein